MKRHVNLAAVVVALLGLGVAHGQGPTILPPMAKSDFSGPFIANNCRNNPGPANNAGADVGEHPNAPRPEGGQPTGAGNGPPVYGPGISDWIAYPRGCDCCGPVGKHGPIATEVYARSGISWLTGGGV